MFVSYWIVATATLGQSDRSEAALYWFTPAGKAGVLPMGAMTETVRAGIQTDNPVVTPTNQLSPQLKCLLCVISVSLSTIFQKTFFSICFSSSLLFQTGIFPKSMQTRGREKLREKNPAEI